MIRSPSSSRVEVVIALVVFLAIRASSGLRCHPPDYTVAVRDHRRRGRRLALVSALYAGLTFVMAYPFSASPGSLVLADAPDTSLSMDAGVGRLRFHPSTDPDFRRQHLHPYRIPGLLRKT